VQLPFRILGILNATPDSFYAGSRHRLDSALAQAQQMVNEGANALDIGGQSTRPGAAIVSVQEEIDRVLPIIEALHKTFPNLPLSIDTFRSKVAKVAVQAGATWVNDISFGQDDPDMFETLVGFASCGYIGMHKQGQIANMQANPEYGNVTQEIQEYLLNRASLLRQMGFNGTIVLDPGFGFGKTLNHNYSIIKHWKSFLEMPYPVLMGISRKSMIYKKLGLSPEEALNGTTALHGLALSQGPCILRVHDVREARETITLLEAVLNSDSQ
jgi:dihydropteroate synthase